MVATESMRFVRRQFQIANEELSAWANGVGAAERAGESGQAPGVREWAEIYEVVAASCLSFPDIMRRVWQAQHDQLAREDDPRGAVARLRDFFREGLGVLQRLQAVFADLERVGVRCRNSQELEAALTAAQQLVDLATGLQAWMNESAPPVDPAMRERARKDFQAGDYQGIGELIRELEAGRSEGD